MDAMSLIRQALAELHQQRSVLDRQIAAVEAIVGGASRSNTTRPAKRRSMGRAAREAARRRMKAYWAKRKRAGAKQAPKAAKAKRRRKPGSGAEPRTKSTNKQRAAGKTQAPAGAGAK